jgi:hypothetical protein
LGKDEAIASLIAADRDPHERVNLEQLETDGGAVGFGCVCLRAMRRKTQRRTQAKEANHIAATLPLGSVGY